MESGVRSQESGVRRCRTIWYLLGFFLVINSLLVADEDCRSADEIDYDCLEAIVVENKIDYTHLRQFEFFTCFHDLAIGGLLQVDGRLFIGEHENKSTFLIRRARVFFTGSLYNTFNYMLIGRWDNMVADIYQAWVEWRYPTWAHLRVGMFKEPFSLQALNHDAYLTFDERSLVVFNYLQIIDIGAMVWGRTENESFEYGIGFFNGRGEKFDNNNNKEVVGRVVIGMKPFYGKLFWGLSGSKGRMNENISGNSFQTGGGTKFFTWANNAKTPVMENGGLIRWGTDVEYLRGPLRFAAEYLHTDWGRIDMGNVSSLFRGYGAYTEVSYLVTGETKPRNGPVIPHHNFNGCDKWGAFELGIRYEHFYASNSVIKDGMATGANRVYGPTVAFNWYFNPYVSMKLDGIYLKFNRGVVVISPYPIHHEALVICRVQACF